VKVNCAAIPAGLLESELFGHERGAFTGPVARGIGRFERAHRGALFLDEIGDLPLELQPKILWVMQERQFERLGGAATIHTDSRVVCVTHRNLVEMVDQRQFRADLFYRLSVFPIELPPLRERLRCSHAKANYGHFRGIHDGSGAACMAGQRPGVAKLHRAFCDSRDWRGADWFAAHTRLHNPQRLEKADVGGGCHTGTGGEFAHPSDNYPAQVLNVRAAHASNLVT
jgi:hypothetical protein